MTSKTLTTEQPHVHAIAAADASLMRAGLPTHAQIMADNAEMIRNLLGPAELVGIATPRATSGTDYLHMQAFNVVITHPMRVNKVITVLAKNKSHAIVAARQEAEQPGLRLYRGGSFTVSTVEAWKVHDWDKMDERPQVFSSRVQALDCARFHGQGKFQIDELSRAVFYRDPDFKPAPAPAPEAPAVEADPAWEEQKRAAVAYVQDTHCIPSGDTIECDADTAEEDFSAGEDGVWVRGWLFAPKSALPGYEG